jgi:pyruvate-formate lyase-activating enzyme
MIRMPWNNASAPGAMIEVTDACNVACVCCYKKLGDRFKTLTEVERDIDDACRLRPLHTLSISGGEPTLHPDLCTIIERIKRRGLLTFLLTNGVLVDERLAHRLKCAGLDAILFHVDTGQRRADIAGEPDFDAVKARLTQLARLAAAAGLDASASMTLLEDAPEQLGEIIEFFLASRDLSFLFLARGITPEQLYGDPNRPAPDSCESSLTLQVFMEILEEHHDLLPFSCIPDRTGQGTNWVTYFIPIIHDRSGYRSFRIQSSGADLALMRLHRMLSGRYVQKTGQNSAVTLLRTVVNGLATRRPLATFRFIAHLARPGACLRHKMIVYDHGPTWTAERELSYCEYCATAIVRDGALLPCCLADCQPEKDTSCC